MNMAQMNLSTQQKQTHSHTGQTCACQVGGVGNGVDRVFWVISCKLLHLEWIRNEVLLYRRGNYIQSLGIDRDGREYKKGNVSQKEKDKHMISLTCEI